MHVFDREIITEVTMDAVLSLHENHGLLRFYIVGIEIGNSYATSLKIGVYPFLFIQTPKLEV